MTRDKKWSQAECAGKTTEECREIEGSIKRTNGCPDIGPKDRKRNDFLPDVKLKQY